jgi:predicted DNA-binding mobile mystery protein A
MKKNKLQIQQLSDKIEKLVAMATVVMPSIGWIKTIRTGIGMSLEQLGKKLSVTKQAIQDIENREREGSITIKSMHEIANALDMKFVYAIVPKNGSLDEMIEKRALEIAKVIVQRTSNTMKLEDQENSHERIQKAIKERAEEIINKTPKILWD